MSKPIDSRVKHYNVGSSSSAPFEFCRVNVMEVTCNCVGGYLLGELRLIAQRLRFLVTSAVPAIV